MTGAGGEAEFETVAAAGGASLFSLGSEPKPPLWCFYRAAFADVR